VKVGAELFYQLAANRFKKLLKLMHEDFAGNAFGTSKALELTSSLQTFSGSVSPLDPHDYYGFNLSNHSSFNLTLSGLDANADVELLNSRGEVLQNLAQLGTSSESLFTTLDAGSYYIKVYSGAFTTTDYNLNLSATSSHDATSLQNQDYLTGFSNPSFDTGVFTVGSSGQVSLDYLFDGGLYQGELAIFSLEGMDQYQTDLNEFIAEAARRALSGSDFGHVVISDSTDGARFHGSFPWELDYNSGEYLGVNTFSMRPGDTFAVMLVPNGMVQQVFENPGVEGAVRPLFSLSTSNPNDAFHVGQIADVTGEGNTFVMEDLRMDGCSNSDQDYNDVIFQVRGATGSAVRLDEVINPVSDWRNTDLGQALINYARPYVTSPEPIESESIASLPEDTIPAVTSPVNSDVTSAEPIDSELIANSSVESQPVNVEPPASNQPLVGIIDTGFSANNPDIDYSRIILGSDRISNDDNPLLQPGEGNEHGTHVLGIIGAIQNNGIGIYGVNDEAPIWVGRAVGSGQWAESLVEFVNAARDSNQPNTVVNLSMDLTQVNPDGSVTTRYEFTPQERAAIEYARQYNVLIVAAAGNDGGVMSVLGQASQEFDNIITVGSAQNFDPAVAPANGFNRADYSSYGYGLDIMANGGTTEQPVLSTVGDGVGTMAGTSVATAEVTGAVSQVWAANPQLSYRQVIEIIKSTATDLDKPNWDAITGAGLLNLAAAVLLAKVTIPEEYDAPATIVPESWSGEGRVTPSERAAGFNYPIVDEPFDGTVAPIGAPYYGVAYRRSPQFSDTWGAGIAAASNTTLQFDAWTWGEVGNDFWYGNEDALWYRVTGTEYWVPSVYIAGYPPSSPSLLPPNSQPPLQPNPNVPIDGNSPNYRNGNVNPFARNPYLIGQCTWYAYGRMLETGLLPAGAKANGWFLGNAEAWRRDATRAGLPVSSTPTPGARGLVVWPPGVRGGHPQYGHVAFVEEVYPDGRIRISESNWAGQGISQRTLTAAQYSGLSFVRLENATPNPSFSSPPARSGQQREYRVRPGDTLSAIAYRELGDANRWREITKADGSTFTEEEARGLQVGMSVYLPVAAQTGTDHPVTPPPDPQPILLPDINSLLLSTNSPDLAATYRIGSPTPPDIKHDDGFSKFPKESPTWNDRLIRAKWRAAAEAISVPNPLKYLPDGAAAYLYYQDGGGADRNFSYDKFVNDDAKGKIALRNLILDAQNGAENLYRQIISQYPAYASREVQFNISSSPIVVGNLNDPRFPYPETENWQKAIGGHSVWLSSSVTVTPGQPPSYKLNFTLHAEDRYNFNPGQSDITSGTPDAENGRLVVVGLANEYMQYSTLEREVTWKQGDLNNATISNG
jgi:surface antigen